MKGWRGKAIDHFPLVKGKLDVHWAKRKLNVIGSSQLEPVLVFSP
jgi:hypothetical protein